MTLLNRRRFLKASAQSATAASLAGIAGFRLSEAAAADDALESNPALRIESWIKDYTATSPRNSIRNNENEKAWEEPLVGFSGGADPIFKQYKEYVGPFHWTPLEIYQLTYPNQSVKEEETHFPLTSCPWR